MTRKSSELRTRLRDSSCRDGLNGREYVPVDAIDKIVTKESIKTELGRKSTSNKSPLTLQGCLADRVERKNAKRLFVILVHLSGASSWDIKELLDAGFTDKDLPLTEDGDELRSSRDLKKKFSPPEDWEDTTVHDFILKQWMVLAPFFSSTGEHKILHQDCPLPFSEVVEVASFASRVVYKAQIHPSYQEGFLAETPNLRVALKEFRKFKGPIQPNGFQNYDSFTQEREILDKIRGLVKNKHITQKLGTFSQRDKNYIIFPWADGGDLKNFWSKESSKTRTPQLAMWCLEQMLGLSEALRALHQEMGNKSDEANCRHGDLKPANILHFITHEYEFGVLKIADFGVSKIHENATFRRLGTPTNTQETTWSYEAPEALSTRTRSRKYDIWSLGCIFLEFTIWIVRGWEAVQTFENARKPESTGQDNQDVGRFYQVMQGGVKVHPKVEKCFADLEGVAQCKEGTALGDLLAMIKTELIQVDFHKRLGAKELYERLGIIVEKAKSNPFYLFNNENLAVAS